MATEPKEPTPFPPPPAPAAAVSAQPVLASFPVCPWEDFLTGKKMSPEKFLASMAKGAITLPDDADRQRFTAALINHPEHMARFIALLQASTACGDTLRTIIGDFAEAAIRRLQLITIPEPLDATGFGHSVSFWLAGMRKKPLTPPELNLLFLLLHFGSLRQVLDHGTAFGLVASAVSKPSEPSSKLGRITSPTTSLDVLLTSPPTRPVLASLVAQAMATDGLSTELNQRIERQAEEIAGHIEDVARLEATIIKLQGEIAALRLENGARNQRVQELDRQIVDLRDGYQHKLDALRGRISGMLQSQITRWLQTALDATRAIPPRTAVVEERLEETLKLIEKEVQCLQPSA